MRANTAEHKGECEFPSVKTTQNRDVRTFDYKKIPGQIPFSRMLCVMHILDPNRTVEGNNKFQIKSMDLRSNS